MTKPQRSGTSFFAIITYRCEVRGKYILKEWHFVLLLLLLFLLRVRVAWDIGFIPCGRGRSLFSLVL